MKVTRVIMCLTISMLLFLSSVSAAEVRGAPMQWHKTVIDFEGPQSSESATPNPFSDYRLDVTFTGPSDQHYNVPGYYAADGNAAETSADAGTVWQVSFPPDEAGTWKYKASFVTGKDIAAQLSGGKSAGYFDGETGTFGVAATDKIPDGLDFRGKGKLVYAGAHYLRFVGTGEHFIKAGANSPEVFLQYADFDNTPSDRAYVEHVEDWGAGDPIWKGDKGKGIIGVVNYLAEMGLNANYFLTMNHQGDGKCAWPWVSTDDAGRYDCSKLAQWEIVFTHFDRKGLMLQFVLTETENESFFEMAESGKAGGFATLRKIYYREMVARFGHHMAITWNLGEENGWDTGGGSETPNSDQQRKDFASHLRYLTYYDDHIAVHNGPADDDHIYESLIGYTALTGPSLQWIYEWDIHGFVGKWRARSRAAGHPWVLSIDEPFIGSKDDADTETWRKSILWGSFMAGGAGAEFYIGSGGDLRVQNYRDYARYYRPAGYAVKFFRDHVPFHLMEPDDDFAEDAWTLKQDGAVYLLYLRDGGSTAVDLPEGSYNIRWFDPRNGGGLQEGEITEIQGGAPASVGTAPSEPGGDWAVLIVNTASETLTRNITPDVYVERDGVVMMEVESAPLKDPGFWKKETKQEDYSGTSYYVSRDHAAITNVNTVDESTTLGYRVLIARPGNYRLGIRNYHGHANIGDDNDNWTRLDGRPWIKTWSHRFQDMDGDYTWTWETGHDTGGDTLLFPVFEDVDAGEHTLYIAARSPNWCIDRLYLVKVDYDRATYHSHPPEPYGDYDLFDSAALHQAGHPLSDTAQNR